MMKCKDCGTQMKPLLYTYFCPNDCDRKVDLPESQSIGDDLRSISEVDPDLTPPYGMPLFGPQLTRPCPKCGSIDTEDFSFGQYHCWPCGHVW